MKTATSSWEQTYFVLNTIVFLLYTFSALYVLLKRSCKLDKSSLITIVVDLISFMMIFLNWTLNFFLILNQHITYVFVIVDIVATFLVGFITYYYSFEMRIVYNTLESQSHEAYKATHTKTLRIRNVLFLLLIFTLGV